MSPPHLSPPMPLPQIASQTGLPHSNIIEMDPSAFLPRWRWEDLHRILSETLPASLQPQLTSLLEALKLDAPSMTSRDVLADLLVAIRVVNLSASLTSCRDATTNTS